MTRRRAWTKLYQSGLPREEILKRRATIFADINADYAQLKPHLSGLERFDLDKEPINNAVLINYLIYFHDLDSFAKPRPYLRRQPARHYQGDNRAGRIGPGQSLRSDRAGDPRRPAARHLARRRSAVAAHRRLLFGARVERGTLGSTLRRVVSSVGCYANMGRDS